MRLNLSDYSIPQNTVQTERIQAVLDEATEKGGLTVVIPRGTYITGTLNLGTASLYLEKGAVLLASGDWNDYRPNGFVHNEMIDTVCLLYAMNAHGISISGEGTIDLNADAFYSKTRRFTEEGDHFTEEQLAECPRWYPHRPSQPIFFYHCTHVKVEGVTLKNAPCWTMSFHSSEDIRVLDVTIENGMDIPNSDGMHFCSCRNVIIRGCSIAAGDDCIALSGITDWNRPCENVTISDCIMTSASKALSIGYMHSIVRNVTVSNCVIHDAQRGICLMASKGTGLVEHVLISNVRIDTHIRAGNWWGNGEPICFIGTRHDYTGYLNRPLERNWDVSIRDVTLTCISCSGENYIGVIGENNNIQDVTFRDITFEMLESKNRHLKGDRRIDISPSEGEIIVPEDFEGFIFSQGCQDVQILHAEFMEPEQRG